MIEKIKGMFFDMDDTLINFGGVTKQAWELTCEKLLKEKPEIGVEAKIIAKRIYDINEAFWADEEGRPKGNVDFRQIRKEIIEQAFTELGLSDEEAVTFLLDNYATNKEEAMYVFPKVHETLQALKDKGIKLVMITNGDGQRQRGKIARFGLEQYFDLFLIEGEQEFGKPDPRVYQKAIDFCGITAQEACMVGDNYLWEVEAPIKLGMKGVWITTQDNLVPPTSDTQADLIITNISELLSW